MAVSQVMPESGSRVERRRARNRDALVAAARGLFTRQGFEATTIAQIAEAADLGFGTFYHYFPDKEAVLDAVLDLAQVEIDAVLTHPENETAPPPVALTGLTTRFARAARRNHDILVLFWQVGVRGEAPGAKRVRIEGLPPERLLPVMLAATIRRIVERGVAAAEFKAIDARLVAQFISSTHMYLLSPPAQKVREQGLVDALCEFQLRALGAAEAYVPQRKARRGGR